MPISPRLVVIAFILSIFAVAPVHAVPDVRAFFDVTQQRLTRIAALPAGGRPSACASLIGDVFDVTALSRVVASPDQWSVMRTETRDQMAKAIAGRIAKECIAMADRADPALARIGRVREVAGGVRLTVLIPDDQGRERVVIWSLRAGGRLGWTATDLSIDGRAAAASLRQDFESALAARPGPVSDAVAYFAAMGAR